MRRETQKVWITACADDAAREFEVSFDPDATIEQLGTALAKELSPNVGSDWVLTSARLDHELSPTDRILDSGLVSGDRLEIQSEARAEVTPDTGGAVDLVVVGGPLLGTRYRLDLGRHLLGRGSGADVTIEDPSMSRAHLAVSVTAEGVTVADAGSTNGSFIDGERISGTRTIGPDDVIEAGGSLLAIEPALALGATSKATGVTIPFNRPPRIRPATRDLIVEVPAPPDEPTKPRIPLAVSIVPLIIGIVLVLLFPENKAMLLFFAMTPVIAVWSFIEERRSGAKSFRAQSADYATEIGAIEEQMAAFVELNLHDRRDAFPDAAELTVRVRELSPRLWERRPSDPDFLAVRVGWGDEPSNVQMTAPTTGSRSLRDETAARLARFTMLRAVPIVVPLRDARITGLCGDPDDVDALARWAITQLATLHSPDELEMSALLASSRAATWDWLKWLPHFGAQADRGRIVFEDQSLNLIESVAPESDARAARGGPHNLVVVDGESEVPRSALGRLLRAAGPDLSILWLGKDPRELPGECRAVVEIDTSSDRLLVVDPERGESNEHHGPEGITDDHARAIAHALAPVRDAGLGPRRRSVPTRVGLWETLGIAEPSPDAVRAGWGAAGARRTVRLGSAGGAAMEIDLRRDGPHALIGGTTGSGKSELLRSIAASIAFDHAPDKVNLLLLDYKGGTAFEELTPLPHVVGSVTDLDRHLARRTLVSLDAELKRREVVLRGAGARDVKELGDRNDVSLPDLVIVVDEFAALVTDLPRFVDGMVDVAQRGRALGLHLILATQKPAGVVSEKIRANTNLRIALRMSDEADSMDVIGLPDAAHIPRTIAGRGFVRMGHGEVVEFQSPFASASAVMEGPEGIVLRRLGPAGVEPDDDRDDSASAATTELDALIDAVVAASGGIPSQASPVLPPLPEVFGLSELGAPSGPGRFPIGLMDEPAAQRQQPFELDFDKDGSVLVFGSGGSGKTTLLRTIAASLSTYSSPEQTHIYALDLGARGLGALQALPHCGSVIFADEEERIRRLFGMLRDEIARRRASASAHDDPRIVVLLDGYAGFAAAFERVDFGEMVDTLPRLIADGRPVGIHFVITADRRGAVPAALTGIIASRIVLRLADDDEYSAFGLSAGPDAEALSTRGRAFLSDGIVMQCVVPGADASVTDQLEAIAKLAATIETTSPAPPIRSLPTDLEADSLPAPTRRWTIPVGLDERFEAAVCDVSEGHLAIAGPRRSGRTTTLGCLATQATRADSAPSIFFLSPRVTGPPTSARAVLISGMEECERWLETSQETLERSGPSLVLIDDGDELFEVPSADALQRTMRWARDRDVRFVIAVETHTAHRAFGGWFAELKKEKHGLVLEPDIEVDGDLFGSRLPRRKLSFPPGRGYLLSRGESKLIQVGRPSSQTGSGAGPDPGSRPGT